MHMRCTALVPQEVGGKYGINFQKDELDGLKRIYGQFLENIIPLGDQQLKVGCLSLRRTTQEGHGR